MDHAYLDVFDFQRKHPTRAGREKALMRMSYEEIMHIAHSCPSPQGGVYYEEQARRQVEADQMAAAALVVWEEELVDMFGEDY